MKSSQSVLSKALLILSFAVCTLGASAQPEANFTSDKQTGCPPMVVSFQDLSSGYPTSWKWDLGNGVTSSLQNPITTYFDPGEYKVVLRIQGATGSDSVVKEKFIVVYENPQAQFSVSNTTGCFPLEVSFFENSNAGNATITDYLWDMGDGNISTEAAPVHIYTGAGLFDITLQVKNSNGCSNTITKSDLIKIDNGVIADFEITSMDVCKSPAQLTFKNKSTGAGNITYLWDYGDGSTSTNFAPFHKYTQSGTYTIVLTAKTDAGCTDTASQKVIIAIPTSTFSVPGDLCAGQTQVFTNNSVPVPISSIWYFGDGTTSNSINAEKAYDKPGVYQVKLVNTFSATCKDSTTAAVTVGAGPAPSFTADDTTNCTAPFSVSFKNTSKGATKYVWNFGDGSTSQEENPSHTYKSTGNFTVTLKAINPNGCENVITKSNFVLIQPVIITGLKGLPDSGCAPLTIRPVALLNIAATVQSYNWDFGDGSTSVLESPVHTYTKEGRFTVKLSIVTNDGCSTTYTLPNAVAAGHRPTASFTENTDTICAKENILVTNTSSNGPIHSLQWDWGPILPGQIGQVYGITPVDTGYRNITLVAFNYGCPDTLIKDSAFYVLPPFARISALTSCTDKLNVNYGDSSVADITRRWSFGDGKTDTTKHPAHRYTTPGFYNVELITHNGNCTDTAYTTVRLINETGTILLSDSIFCRDSKVNFNINGVNAENIRNTKWDFGNGQTETVNGLNTAYIYDTTGVFTIKATMTDLNGCQYVLTLPYNVTIFGPKGAFYSKTPGICQDAGVEFIDNSRGDGIHPLTKWSWDFGDGFVQDYTSGPFFHSYSDTGFFTVKLYVTDSYGCTDTIKRPNYINVSHPFASFNMSDSVVCPDKQVSLPKYFNR